MNLFTKQGIAQSSGAFLCGLLLSVPAAADDDLAPLVDARSDEAVALARDLFDYAELGYLEWKRTPHRAIAFYGDRAMSRYRCPSRLVCAWPPDHCQGWPGSAGSTCCARHGRCGCSSRPPGRSCPEAIGGCSRCVRSASQIVARTGGDRQEPRQEVARDPEPIGIVAFGGQAHQGRGRGRGSGGGVDDGSSRQRQGPRPTYSQAPPPKLANWNSIALG